MSRIMTKPTKWHVRPAKTQISLGIRQAWSETSLCAQWVAKDPSFLHADSEDSDQTGRMPRLIWVFAGRTATLLVLSWGVSYNLYSFSKHTNLPTFLPPTDTYSIETTSHIWASSWDYGTYHIGDQWGSVRAVSPEPSLFAHMKYGSRRSVRPKFRHLAPLDDRTYAFEEWVYGGREVPYSHKMAHLILAEG